MDPGSTQKPTDVDAKVSKLQTQTRDAFSKSLRKVNPEVGPPSVSTNRVRPQSSTGFRALGVNVSRISLSISPRVSVITSCIGFERICTAWISIPSSFASNAVTYQ